MSTTIQEINNIQYYLIGGFMEYGYTEEYKILPPGLFGIFAPMFTYLVQYGNARTPEYYDLCTKIGNEEIVKCFDRADISFISHRGKFIEKLYNFHVSEVLM